MYGKGGSERKGEVRKCNGPRKRRNVKKSQRKRKWRK